MRQIRHIVPGIYHREIKKATNYVRRTNGNKNRNSSVRTTYSSGGSSTSVPNNNGEKPIEIEDSKDDTVFTIDSSYLVDRKFEMLVLSGDKFSIDNGLHPERVGQIYEALGNDKEIYIDWGDGEISEFKNKIVNTHSLSERKNLSPKFHKYKSNGIYKIQVHHKGFPLFITNIVLDRSSDNYDSDFALAKGIANSIIDFKQFGLCIEYPSFNVVSYASQDSMNGENPKQAHSMVNLQAIPPLPHLFMLDPELNYSYTKDQYTYVFTGGDDYLYEYRGCGLKTLPNGFFENVVSFDKKHDTISAFSFYFAESKIETLPEDLFKPYETYSTRNIIIFNGTFEECPIKDKFPPKYQPLDWKTENGQELWLGIFSGCKTIPNYDEIPPNLRLQ